MIKKRKSKQVPAHYGMTDYYKFYTKNYDNPVSSSVYNKVISEFNDTIIDNILNNYKTYLVPFLRVRLSIRKMKPTIRFKDGVVVNNNPVDWVTTKKLWENDDEAKENKTLVRFLNKHTFGYVFRVYVHKSDAKFKHRSIYRFKINRKFQRLLSKRIKDKSKDKFEAYLLYNKH